MQFLQFAVRNSSLHSKNISLKRLISKYAYNQALYYEPEMYNLSPTSTDHITDKYNTSNEQRELLVVTVARNDKKKSLAHVE
jgi:hypothetical protein